MPQAQRVRKAPSGRSRNPRSVSGQKSRRPHAGFRSLRVFILLGLVGALLLGGAIWWLFLKTPPSLDEIPVILPEPGPLKVRPEDPETFKVPHRDKTIYHKLAPEEKSATTEHILEAPEEPIPLDPIVEKENKGVEVPKTPLSQSLPVSGGIPIPPKKPVLEGQVKPLPMPRPLSRKVSKARLKPIHPLKKPRPAQ